MTIDKTHSCAHEPERVSHAATTSPAAKGIGLVCPAPGLPPLLEGLDQPAITLDANRRILQANQAYRDLFNGGRRVCGQLCHEISHRFPVPCDQAGSTCPLASAKASGKPAQCLHVHNTVDGEEMEIATVYPLRDEVHQVCGYLEILTPTAIAAASPSKHDTLVGRSTRFLEMLNLMARVSPTSTTVLLLGESGTGKELVARAIHKMSSHARGPFVPLECSGLTETLFESELFGHEKGSFTGAHSRKRGLTDSANGGTLFLDEIGDIPLALQVKLLRLIETGRYRRVGSAEQIRSDFRLVCATHRDLNAMVAKSEFREDLFYRISAFPISLPPLRERLDDLQLLADCIFHRLGCDGRCRLEVEALRELGRYSFPGNVRELHNILERACLLADDGLIRCEHLPEWQGVDHPTFSDTPFPLDSTNVLPVEVVESRYIQWLTHHFDGSRAQLADLLGISERTLYRKMQDH